MEEMNKLTVVDENGTELEFEILFTFDSPEYEKNYVVYVSTDEADLDEDGYPEIHVSSYTVNADGEGGGLEPIEDETEWDMIEEVVANFIDDMEELEDDEPVS